MCDSTKSTFSMTLNRFKCNFNWSKVNLKSIQVHAKLSSQKFFLFLSSQNNVDHTRLRLRNRWGHLVAYSTQPWLQVYFHYTIDLYSGLDSTSFPVCTLQLEVSLWSAAWIDFQISAFKVIKCQFMQSTYSIHSIHWCHQCLYFGHWFINCNMKSSF